MYGLLGKKLGHSFSKEIHETFTKKEYKLIETDHIDSFMENKDFLGVNVTIPYKRDVIPYIDELSMDARAIGVVNTIVNKDGILYGYNTDIYGIRKVLAYKHISLTNKTVMILGNGSTSRTIQYLALKEKAKEIIILARNPKEKEYPLIDFSNFTNTQIIFNATPVGMYPNNLGSFDFDLSLLTELEVVMDAIYNPLASSLLVDAKKMNVTTINGLLMLIFQACKAIELFHGYQINDRDVLTYYNKLLFKLTNFVFIGMPMSGKSHFSKVVGRFYDKVVVDLDNEIERSTSMTIPDIFKTYGEEQFRTFEQEEVLTYSKRYNQAISCGGGVIKNQKNIDYLKQNGIVLFIDFPLSELVKCNPKGRPLLQKRDTLEKLYKERYNLYKDNADIIIHKRSYDEVETMRQIEVKIDEYFNTKWS